MNIPMYRMVTVGWLCLLLTACGFQLRQPVQLPSHLQQVYVQGGSNELNRELSGILASSATLVDSADQAQAIVQLVAEKQHRRTLSVNQRGKVQEMELHYSVGFRVRQHHDLLRPAQKRGHLCDGCVARPCR